MNEPEYDLIEEWDNARRDSCITPRNEGCDWTLTPGTSFWLDVNDTSLYIRHVEGNGTIEIEVYRKGREERLASRTITIKEV